MWKLKTKVIMELCQSNTNVHVWGKVFLKIQYQQRCSQINLLTTQLSHLNIIPFLFNKNKEEKKKSKSSLKDSLYEFVEGFSEDECTQDPDMSPRQSIHS